MFGKLVRFPLEIFIGTLVGDSVGTNLLGSQVGELERPNNGDCEGLLLLGIVDGGKVGVSTFGDKNCAVLGLSEGDSVGR